MPLLDALKGVAAQLIVLHHLVSYGPLAEAASGMQPVVAGFLFDYGRMVVQVFLVIGGYLSARALVSGAAYRAANPLPQIWRRYRRLAVPFVVAMLLATVGAALARHWMVNDAIPEAPSAWQFLAHAMLLHGVVDVPSMSAGVWYVAIDLQLFVLLLLSLWVGYRLGGERYGLLVGGGLVAGLALAALFHFNRDAGWDDWGIYFFGSYALGACAWWAANRKSPALWFAGVVLVTFFALAIDFRLRILLALGVAAVLAIAGSTGVLNRWPQSPLLAWLGRVSYSVFLVHFPVCLVVNAAYARFLTDGTAMAATALFAAWGLSLLAGAAFYRYVEARQR